MTKPIPGLGQVDQGTRLGLLELARRLAALEAAPPGAGVTDHGALTGLADDDHPHYLNNARGDARYSLTSHNHTGTYDPAGTAASAVSAHEADTTSVHGIADTSALLDTGDIGVSVAAQVHTHSYEAAGAVAAHEAAADPHTGYQKESEKGAVNGYASLDGSTKVPIAQLPTGTSGTTVALGNDSRFTDTRTPTDNTVSTAKIVNDAVDNTKLADMAESTIKGRDFGAGTGDPTDLTAAQVAALLPVATITTNGTMSRYDKVYLNDLVAGIGTAGDKGDITVASSGGSLTIDNNAVTNAKLADVGTATLKGRVTAGTGDPEDLTGTQATTLLDTFTSTLKGLAPASGGGTSNFLRADGTWTTPTASATAGGSNTDFQYNNAGAIGGTSALQLVSSIPTFADEAAFTSQTAHPATPSAGSVRLGAADRTGVPLMWAKNALGMRMPIGFQGGMTIVEFLPLTTTTLSTRGFAATAVGTVSTPTPSAPGAYANSYRRTLVTSAGTANSEASLRAAAALVAVGTTQGWMWRARVNLATLPANARGFFGLSTTTGTLSTTFDPAAGTNYIGFGWGVAQTQLRFLCNDGTSTPTATILGADFSTTTTGEIWDLFLWNPPGSSTVYWAAERRSNGAVVIGSESTNLPTAFLAPHLHMNNGGSAAACAFGTSFMRIESLF